MKYSEIITLAQAGFTAQQIAQMAQVEAATQSAPAPAAAPQPAPAPAITQPTPVPATVQQTPDQLTAILAEMQTLKQTMQAQNRQNAELIPPTPQSAQDILSSIIAPQKTGEK
jgi:small-conductance mechanosensitive channel